MAVYEHQNQINNCEINETIHLIVNVINIDVIFRTQTRTFNLEDEIIFIIGKIDF